MGSQCCAIPIIRRGRVCSSSMDVGCIQAVTTSPTSTLLVTEVPARPSLPSPAASMSEPVASEPYIFCQAGIPQGSACCPSSCGGCGGTGCSQFPGGYQLCCGAHVRNAARACTSSYDVGCVNAKSLK